MDGPESNEKWRLMVSNSCFLENAYSMGERLQGGATRSVLIRSIRSCG